MSKNKTKDKQRKGSKKTVNILTKLILVLVSLIAVALGALGFMSKTSNQQMKEEVEIDTIYSNIFVNDVDIGNLTKEEALNKLKDQSETPLLEHKLIFIEGDAEYEYLFKDFNAKYDMQAAVETAYNYAREGKIKDRYNKILTLSETPYELVAQYTYDENLLKETVTSLAEKVRIEPINATISRKNGAFSTTKEQAGRFLNVDATFDIAKQLLDDNQSGQVIMVMEPLEAEYVEADFDNARSLIGTFSTKFTPGENGRNANIKNALNKINDYVVYPGEVFSTNYAFGPSTFENGYQLAKEIVGGEFVDGIGGGVCQVSSTLYNTVLYAELEIVERQNHSLKVGYLDYGYDATLAGDYIDFKFKNNTILPIFIEGYIESNRVVVNIFGHEEHSPSRKLAFQNSLEATVPPPAEHVIQDSTLPEGKRVAKGGSNGYRYNLYKIVYENDKETERTLINKSYYKPRRAEVRVGTKKIIDDESAETSDTPVTPTETSDTPVIPAETPETPDTPVTPAEDSASQAVTEPTTQAPLDLSENTIQDIAPTPDQAPPDITSDEPSYQDDMPTMPE